MKYLVVLEKSDNGFGAYVPDLPGCVAAPESPAEGVTLIREAIEFHIEGLKFLSPPPRVRWSMFEPPVRRLQTEFGR